MIVEWLRFQVKPNLRERFIQQDAAVWTVALARYPGFLGKEVWISPERSDELALVIRWATRTQWKAIPGEDLEAIEQEFLSRMGADTYELLESREFQVRKFPDQPIF
jgi:uncharacterized protein (TIGR03792 family)